jgi:SAM-dependent methyltransferase
MAHALVRERVQEGETVVDATVGTGADTVFLAKVAGAVGEVIGFDVQAEALARATRRLEEAGCDSQVTLHERGHEGLGEVVDGPIATVMFNLGYLPGGDKARVTQPSTTVSALRQAVDRLRVGGIVTVVCYTGHPGGQEEAEAVVAWAEALPQERFSVLRYGFLNQRNAPPFLIAVERR